MSKPSRRFAEVIAPERALVRYSFVVAACAMAVAMEFWVDRASGDRLGPFLTAFVAVIACAVVAGPGPGVVSTFLMLIWSVFDLQHGSRPSPEVLLRGFFFTSAGLLLSLGSSRMLRSARDAASSEAWHRQLVETASEGIWVRDENNIIMYANARMAEMLGVPVESLDGRKMTDFFFPEDLSMERIRMQTLTEGAKQQFDRRLRRSDGAELWVLACCNVMPAEARGKVSTLAMMSDITERKLAERALRQSEERFRNLFESVLEGVYQSTPSGRILAANPMLLRMLGLSNEADLNDVQITKDLYVDPSIRPRLLEQLEREGSLQNVEYELRSGDGRTITVLENAQVVRDPSGEVLYYEGTLTDISERKRIEDRLRRAQKIEALGRLAGGVAHDFDMVLEVIVHNLRNVLSGLSEDQEARRSAEQALQAAEGATALTRQLLSFSKRPDAGDGRPGDQAVLGEGETILLVDDEPLVRELSRDMLERQGYRVVVASDPAEAVRLGADRTRSFDVLVADASMPSMSGKELAHRLRALHTGLKVLFICGYADAPLEQADLSPPGTASIQKPFSADSLGRKIRQMLGRDGHFPADET